MLTRRSIGAVTGAGGPRCHGAAGLSTRRGRRSSLGAAMVTLVAFGLVPVGLKADALLLYPFRAVIGAMLVSGVAGAGVLYTITPALRKWLPDANGNGSRSGGELASTSAFWWPWWPSRWRAASCSA